MKAENAINTAFLAFLLCRQGLFWGVARRYILRYNPIYRKSEKELYLMASKSLTDTAIRALKQPNDKNLKVMAGGCPGLYVDVSHRTGEKFFRLQYRFNNKPHLLTLGHYPTMSLSEARMQGLRHKEDLRRGINPCAEKRAAKDETRKQALTFREAAKQWLEKAEPGWGERHRADTKQKLNSHILPRIGDMPIAEIRKAEVKAILDGLDARGNAAIITKARSIIGQIFRFAILQDTPGVEHDPTSLLRGRGLFTTHKSKHMAALATGISIADMIRPLSSDSQKAVINVVAEMAQAMLKLEKR